MPAGNGHQLKNARRGAAITVRVIEGQGATCVNRILEDGTLEIRIQVSRKGTDPNRELIAYLAKILKIKPGQVEIVAGTDRPDKLISLMGIEPELVDKIFMKLINRTA